MTQPEINKLTRNLLLMAVGLSERSELARVTGERLDAVSSVVNDSERPLSRTRKVVADEVARRVYDAFSVEDEDRPPALVRRAAALV
jgi:hypothetical protein